MFILMLNENIQVFFHVGKAADHYAGYIHWEKVSHWEFINYMRLPSTNKVNHFEFEAEKRSPEHGYQ